MRGGVWIPYILRLHTLSTWAAGGFTGKVISRSATCSTQDNLTIWITGLYVKAEPSRKPSGSWSYDGICSDYLGQTLCGESVSVDKMLTVSFGLHGQEPAYSLNATRSETSWRHKLAHSKENYHPVEHRSYTFPSPTSWVWHSQRRANWPGLYKQQHSWKKPKPSMSRSSLLTTVSEELWCALWQAPHLLTQGVSPGHAEVVTACVLGRRGPLLTEYFAAR